MEITTELLRETAQWLEPYFKANLPPAYESRNFSATLRLAQTCDLISVQTISQEQDRMKISLAAWFLYTGFCSDPGNYQIASSELASSFYKEKGLSSEIIQGIKETILATRYPQQPVTIQSQVLCDAETSWMADKSFFQKLELFRKEKSFTGKKEITEKNWIEENIMNLENHIYFIPFSREMFGKKKEKNLLRLKENLTASNSSQSILQEPLSVPKTKGKPEVSLTSDLKLERGVETLFRNTSRNQIHLIRLADYKANMIISINAIIISVILSFLIIRLDANKYLELPTIILVLTNILTILIAISATRPRINMENSADEKLKDVGNNLLFYGNFYKMPFDKFNRDIKKTIIDREYLYDSLTKDIYHQGILLVKKFRKINLSYTVFIVGLILSVIAFTFSFLIHIHSI
jgi:predicted metal-dependent HD superfamily phosphohydrolase